MDPFTQKKVIRLLRRSVLQSYGKIPLALLTTVLSAFVLALSLPLLNSKLAVFLLKATAGAATKQTWDVQLCLVIVAVAIFSGLLSGISGSVNAHISVSEEVNESSIQTSGRSNIGPAYSESETHNASYFARDFHAIERISTSVPDKGATKDRYMHKKLGMPELSGSDKHSGVPSAANRIELRLRAPPASKNAERPDAKIAKTVASISSKESGITRSSVDHAQEISIVRCFQKPPQLSDDAADGKAHEKADKKKSESGNGDGDYQDRATAETDDGVGVMGISPNDLNRKAEAFIAKFYEQMRLQRMERMESVKRYEERLQRGR